MTRMRAIAHVTLCLGLGLALTFRVWGQEVTTPTLSPPAVSPSPTPNGALFGPDMLQFIQVFGFGAMIFFIWWGDYRKIAEFKRLTENYETLSKSYEGLVNKAHDTMLLTMDVNAKLVAKLDFILDQKGPHES